jgi:hypothetical protein
MNISFGETKIAVDYTVGMARRPPISVFLRH